MYLIEMINCEFHAYTGSTYSVCGGRSEIGGGDEENARDPFVGSCAWIRDNLEDVVGRPNKSFSDDWSSSPVS
jgi:hypothetical protein